MRQDIGAYFAGRHIVVPSVAAMVDASAMRSAISVPGRAVAIVATAEGGTAKAVTSVTNLSDVSAKLIGGVGARLTELALAPSGELQGAQQVKFVRVGSPVAASYDVGDATITARIAGQIGNAYRIRRTSIVTGSEWKLEVENARTLETRTYDNLGPVVQLDYSGSGIPVITVTSSSGTVTVQLADGTNTYSYTSDAQKSLSELIDAINGNTEDWTASAYGSLAGVTTSQLIAEAPTVSDNTGYLHIGAEALVLALKSDPFVEAATKAGTLSADGAWHYLASGAEGATPVTQDWIDALAVLESEEVMAVVVGSGDDAVIAAAFAHVQSESDAIHAHERILYCGADIQTDKDTFVSTTKGLCRTYSSSRTVVAGSGIKLTDADTGDLTTYPAYYYAAMAAGMKAGNRPETPLTNKQIAVDDLEYIWSRDDLADLLSAGAMPANYDTNTGRFIVTQSITSYLKDNNVVYREQSGQDSADYLDKALRIVLAPLIGAVGDRVDVLTALNLVKGRLNQEVRSGGSDGILVSGGVNPTTGAAEPPYKNVQAIMGGDSGLDVVAIQYEAHITTPINYELVTTHLTPVKLVVNA